MFSRARPGMPHRPGRVHEWAPIKESIAGCKPRPTAFCVKAYPFCNAAVTSAQTSRKTGASRATQTTTNRPVCILLNIDGRAYSHTLVNSCDISPHTNKSYSLLRVFIRHPYIVLIPKRRIRFDLSQKQYQPQMPEPRRKRPHRPFVSNGVQAWERGLE